MNKIRLFFAYICSLLVLPLSIFGLFHTEFLRFTNDDLAFYVRVSSIFTIAVSFFLSWYYANVLIKEEILEKANDFGVSIINFDFEKISKLGLMKITDETIHKIGLYESSRFEFFGFCIPFTIALITLTTMGILKNKQSFLSYVIGYCVVFLIMKFANALSKICNIKIQGNEIMLTLKKLAVSIQGIQFYNAKEFIKTKLKASQITSLKDTENQISKAIWKSFIYTCLLFIVIIFSYIIKRGHLHQGIFNIEKIEVIYLSSLLVSFIFVSSFLKTLKMRKLKFADNSRNQLEDKNKGVKRLKESDLFIAFHGVYFNDPEKLSDESIINDLSFSILPGEFVTITGENTLAKDYLFGLILKFYKPQSGQIYIAGSKVEKIPSQNIRSLFGIFEEDFGLINGTIFENLEMLTNNRQKIIEVAKKVGLDEILNEKLFKKSGKMKFGQEVLFRIQIARNELRNADILIIKAPESFETEKTEQIFYDFIDYHSGKETILLMTENPSMIIYSDKIIYLSKKQSLFGTHAALSRNKAYQRFINRL